MEESQNEDIVMEQQEEEEQGVLPVDPDKIIILPGGSEDGSAASFQIKNEDHTLGNALRYIILKNPEVEFCGYSIPHPSEARMNIRIQTYGRVSAIDALEKGLDDLVDCCDHVESVFKSRLDSNDYPSDRPI